MFKLRCLFLIIFLVLGINGNPKQSDLENDKTNATIWATEKGGFLDILESIFDYFNYEYDSDEEESRPSNNNDTMYFLCRNCTVVINQQNTSKIMKGISTTKT